MIDDSPGNAPTSRFRVASVLDAFLRGTGVVAVLLLSISAAHAQQAAPAKDYVGKAECRTCHSALYRQFEQTEHWKTTLDVAASHGAHGCESCHGPGRAHADSFGDPKKIVSFRALSRAEATRRCLECHESSQEHANFRRSAHRNADVGCLDCHSVHHAEQGRSLLRAAQPELCYGCHREQQAEFAQPFRHRVDERLMTCTECHNEHGSLLRRQLRTSASQAAICGKCHSETVGPFVFEHPPQKTDGCTACHTPHGSPNPRLLKVSQVNLLCLNCHSGIGASASLRTPNFHSQDMQYQACNLCHVAIHGSNVDRRFRR